MVNKCNLFIKHVDTHVTRHRNIISLVDISLLIVPEGQDQSFLTSWSYLVCSPKRPTQQLNEVEGLAELRGTYNPPPRLALTHHPPGQRR